MFDNLSQKLTGAFRKLQGRGHLTEENISAALNEVKMALLEADVNFRVVKAFLKSVKIRAVGEEVQSSLTPGQQFIKIVNDELTSLMGEKNVGLTQAETAPTIIMLVGLQGSGKTSSIGKLANYCQNSSSTSYLIPADVYRPAAIDQLIVLANTLNLPFYPSTTQQNPVDIVREGLADAKEKGMDYVMIDTAGRLHIDDELMGELEQIKAAVNPHEIFFVADAMTGQDAVNMAKAFNDRLDISGIILTKMDGDARGGAALSIRAITKKPIKFITIGEKLESLESFHPDRLASRILGMGDMVSLIEKAQSTFNEKEALEMQTKFQRNEFTLEDFQSQLRSMRQMGSIKDLIGMLPGVDSKMLKNANVDEKQMARTDAIISSMTLKERQNHTIINGSRRSRIAKGSGSHVREVNRLLKQFAQMRKMMNKLSKTTNPRKAMQMMQQMMPH
ncbi:MAG: signal recognition particle protein [SAR324 cluster bacterium]|nr:signal recognition particle protein [SAR324 cluster bacterium]